MVAILDFWISPKLKESAEIERQVIKTNKSDSKSRQAEATPTRV